MKAIECKPETLDPASRVGVCQEVSETKMHIAAPLVAHSPAGEPIVPPCLMLLDHQVETIQYTTTSCTRLRRVTKYPICALPHSKAGVRRPDYIHRLIV